MQRILLIEDDSAIAKHLGALLGGQGYEVVHAPTAERAAQIIESKAFDLALVDVSLPDGNGFVLCTRIRENTDVPVLFLTASGDETSVVTGLNMGADDYIVKPFRPRELTARIQAALRKRGRVPEPVQIGALSVDIAAGVVRKNGAEIFLSPLEYRLLLIFINNPKMIITRERLIDGVWDVSGELVTDNTLTVYIKRLREKIEDDPAHPQLIHTVRGIGYRLKAQDT